MRFKRRSSREIEDDEDSLSENLAEVTERLDDLTRQLAKVSRSGSKRPSRRADDEEDDDEAEAFRLRPSRESRAARTDRYNRDERSERDDRDERAARSERAERPPRAERNERIERPEPENRTSDRVAEAIARLDRRLDEVIAEGRNAAAATRAPAYLPHLAPPAQPVPQQPAYAAMMPMPAPAPVPAPAPAQVPPQPAVVAAAGPNQWAMEISARQRVLDEDFAPAPMPAAQPHHHAHPAAMPATNGHAHPAAHNHAHAAAHAASPPRAAMPDLSGLENHLRDITSQIASLQRPYEDALGALRGDLAEIGRALTDALPRRAMEGLEHEIRSLSERVDRIRNTGGGVDGSMLAGLEQGLHEVRDALRHLTPAESLVGVDEAVRGLSRKIDQISVSQQDPGAFQQIEHAISSLRNVVSNVASDGALAQLAAEVRGLAANFERVAAASGPDQFAALDRRISSLVENGRQVPPQLEATIRSLTEQLERSQLSQGDQFALRSLEDRIVRLFEKLDASDARLGSLAAIERGIGDLLVAVGDLRAPRPAPTPAQAPAPMPAPESALHLPQAAQLPPAPPAPRPAPQQAAPQQAMPQQAEPRPYQPVAVAPPPAAQRPPQARAPQPAAQTRPEPRRPIDPHLPPDTPLEPGMGAPRLKPGSPAARIAASEAALGSARPAPAEPVSKSAAVAAARNAARALAEEAPPEPKKSRFSFKKSAAKAVPAPKPRAESRPAPEPEPEPLLLLPADMVMADEAGPSTKAKLLKHGKTLLIATSVVIIVLGVLQTAMDFLSSPTTQPVASQSEPTSSDSDTRTQAPASRPAVPARSMPVPDSPPPAQSEPDPEPTGQIGNRAAFFDPRSVLNTMPKSADVTHSIGNGQTRVASAQPGAQNPAVASLPTSVGPVLRAALSNNDPAAEYEMGLRYAEGRGVTQSADDARRWLERSARAGFAPAQFRLASQNEKGDGVKKDVQAARQLYTAAAEKGHAKAMHNLAVLYAEGVDGKPDYRTAAQWFQRAAGHGVADSQYNLAILYARGIGVTQNLSESYKWFSLAANAGDQDAGRKRDDVAARLDKSTLAAAKQAVQTFTPAAEPEEATSLRTPPGGWDRNSVAAQPTKPRTRPATSGR